MDSRGLVDPKNKPFGSVLPLEVQIRIMFRVECIFTNEKRQKVNQDLKGLPKCDLTLLPQHLGEGRYWNQVVVRLHTLRGSYCHHCHRLLDHRLSVKEKVFFWTWVFSGHSLRTFCFTDWHDGGISTPHPRLGQTHE